ncbi:HEAT repeat domain-containing protein [Nostoc sp.]|uniref:HEAT repeat domain-containing protein n=1 Tax=Nostoc sp. TaxID=1180 RepID=UPI002FF93EB0
MTQKQWKSRTASVIIALAALGATNLPQLANTKAIAQTPSVEPLCTETDIKQYIQQLNEFDATNVNFNALVACNSKAVPALIKALENQDEKFRIITITALGEIGTKAAPSVPILTKLLEDASIDVQIIALHALRQIGQDPIPTLIQALKSKNLTVRYKAAQTLGKFGIAAKDSVPDLETALKDTSPIVSYAASNALRKINTAIREINIAIKNYEQDPYRYNGSCHNCDNPNDISQTLKRHNRTNSLVMCRIPVIQTVFKWKCPRVQRVNNNGR